MAINGRGHGRELGMEEDDADVGVGADKRDRAVSERKEKKNGEEGERAATGPAVARFAGPRAGLLCWLGRGGPFLIFICLNLSPFLNF